MATPQFTLGVQTLLFTTGGWIPGCRSLEKMPTLDRTAGVGCRTVVKEPVDVYSNDIRKTGGQRLTVLIQRTCCGVAACGNFILLPAVGLFCAGANQEHVSGALAWAPLMCSYRCFCIIPKSGPA